MQGRKVFVEKTGTPPTGAAALICAQTNPPRRPSMPPLPVRAGLARSMTAGHLAGNTQSAADGARIISTRGGVVDTRRAAARAAPTWDGGCAGNVGVCRRVQSLPPPYMTAGQLAGNTQPAAGGYHCHAVMTHGLAPGEATPRPYMTAGQLAGKGRLSPTGLLTCEPEKCIIRTTGS